MTGRPKKSEFAFILENSNCRLQSWKGKLLNKAGRLTLAKSILASIPICSMQSFWIPSSICKEIDKVTRRFLWSKSNLDRGIHLINQNKVTLPISAGGLGIHKAHEVNISLLGKLVWDIIQDKNKLWVQVMKHKYLKDSSILSSHSSASGSPIWHAIIKAANHLRDGFRISIVDGNSSFWFDCWTRHGPICNEVDFIHVADSELCVTDC